MKNLKALRERLQQIRADAQAIVDAAEQNEDGLLTDEQQSQFDALMAERTKVEGQIERLEQLGDMDQSAGRMVPPAQPGGNGGAGAGSGARVYENIQDDPMRGFATATEFARAVRDACVPGGGNVDQRLTILGAPANFHRETGSSDGYNVPPAIREDVWRLVFEGSGLLAAVAPEPTDSNQVKLFTDESTPWGATGIQARWGGEGQKLDASRLETTARNVPLHKLHAFVLASDELLSDASRLQSRLTTGAAEAIRWKAGEAIHEGDGVGKPLGWTASKAQIEVAKESDQPAATVVAENVAKMYARLLMMGVEDSFWMINQTVLPELITMTLGDKPIWTPPASGFTGAPGGFLFGRPVQISEHCEVVGTKNDIQLIAPRGYYAANKAGGVNFASSMHLFFDYDIEAFRWTFRLGGQPFLSKPVAQAKGGGTLSHFITLATRD